MAETIESEISSFCSINEGTADGIMVWEAFKAYIQGGGGVLISHKKFRDTARGQANAELRKEIEILEQAHKT